MRKIIFKAIPALIISSGMLFAQYYDPYNYQNDYNYQNNQNNYNAYQNNNVPANNYYNNYYQEFMRTLSEEANNPNSIYYSPGFYEQYNNYNAMQGNPYQDTMNAMNWASQNYNAQPNYNADNTAQNPYQNNYYNYNGYDNTAQDSYQSGYGNYNNQGYYNNNANYTNPYEELMKILETESQNPNSPYYSPNANQNGYNNSYDNTAQNNYYNPYDNTYQNPYQNNYYGAYDNTAQDPYQSGYYTGYDYNAQNYNQTNNNMSDDPYKLAAEALIKAAEELTRKANGMPDQNNIPADNQNLNNNNQAAANNQNTPLYVQDFYTPFKVPQVVLDTAATKYPNVQILDVEVKEIGTYEVRMANNMRLYIDRNGNFLREITDY